MSAVVPFGPESSLITPMINGTPVGLGPDGVADLLSPESTFDDEEHAVTNTRTATHAKGTVSLRALRTFHTAFLLLVPTREMKFTVRHKTSIDSCRRSYRAVSRCQDADRRLTAFSSKHRSGRSGCAVNRRRRAGCAV